MNAQEVLNERQVEEVYGFSISYLRRARRQGHGPRFLNVGKLIRYRRSDIENFLDAHEVATSQPQRGAEGSLSKVFATG